MRRKGRAHAQSSVRRKAPVDGTHLSLHSSRQVSGSRRPSQKKERTALLHARRRDPGATAHTIICHRWGGGGSAERPGQTWGEPAPAKGREAQGREALGPEAQGRGALGPEAEELEAEGSWCKGWTWPHS